MSANLERASAGRNLLIYAALVAVVAGYTVLIWNERPEIETFESPTGLDDGEMLDLEASPLDPDRPLAALGGIAYFASAKAEPSADRNMVKVARDDADRYYFYQFSSEIGGGGVEAGGGLFLKVDPDRYIRVMPTPDKAGDSPAEAGS